MIAVLSWVIVVSIAAVVFLLLCNTRYDYYGEEAPPGGVIWVFSVYGASLAWTVTRAVFHSKSRPDAKAIHTIKAISITLPMKTIIEVEDNA